MISCLLPQNCRDPPHKQDGSFGCDHGQSFAEILSEGGKKSNVSGRPRSSHVGRKNDVEWKSEGKRTFCSVLTTR